MTAKEWVVESCLLDILWVLDSDEILQGHSSAARNHVYKTNSNDSLIHIHSTWPLPVAGSRGGAREVWKAPPPVFWVKIVEITEGRKAAGQAKRVVDVLVKLKEQKSYLRANEILVFTKI